MLRLFERQASVSVGDAASATPAWRKREKVKLTWGEDPEDAMAEWADGVRDALNEVIGACPL